MKKIAFIPMLFLFALLLNACSTGEMETKESKNTDVKQFKKEDPIISNYPGNQEPGGEVEPDE